MTGRVVSDDLKLRRAAPSYWSLGKLAEPEVYFIQAECGPIKIGISVTPAARLHLMQAASPSRLTLLATVPGGKPVERRYHQRFAAFRLHGEWFEPAPAIVTHIRRLNLFERVPGTRGSFATSGPCPVVKKNYAIPRG